MKALADLSHSLSCPLLFRVVTRVELFRVSRQIFVFRPLQREGRENFFLSREATKREREREAACSAGKYERGEYFSPSSRE